MYHALLAVDEEEDRALRQAEFVAGLPDAAASVEATVLHVHPHEDYTGAPPHEFEDTAAAVAAADRLADAGLTVHRVVDGGEVARKVLDHADEVDADVIVLGGRKRSGVAKVVMGSVSMDVLISAERPVTITG